MPTNNQITIFLQKAQKEKEGDNPEEDNKTNNEKDNGEDDEENKG